MKERPILFNAKMARAVLAGTKTQTRRVVDHIATMGRVTQFGRTDTNGYDWIARDRRMLWNDLTHKQLMERCPYGQPGDRLWVRETWARDDEDGTLLFRADDNEATRTWEHERIVSGLPRYRWRPSIHMPRWASRITLEIVGVRVERLHEISEADAVAEGMTRQLRSALGWAAEESEETFNARQARSTFGVLWDAINGAGSWAANPWVWVVEFRTVPA